MSQFKNRGRKTFTQVSNAAARDSALSLKAKGLLLVMLSFPDDWSYHMRHIEGQSADGREAHMNAVKELETHGYLVRERCHDPKGKFSGVSYLVSDESMTPNDENVTSSTNGKTVNGKTADGKTVNGKPATTNTYLTKTDLTKTEASQPADCEEDSQGSEGQEGQQVSEVARPAATDLHSSSGIDQHKVIGQDQATNIEDVPRQPSERSVSSREALARCFKVASFLEQLLTEYPDRIQWLDLSPATIFSLLGKARTQFGQQYATPLIQALDDEAHALTRQKQEASQPAPIEVHSPHATFQQQLEAALRGELL